MSVARELADLPSASPSTDANFDNGTFVIDVSENKVGIGTTTVAEQVTIANNGTAGTAGIRIDAYSTTAANGAKLYLAHSDHATIGTAGAVDAEDLLGEILCQGSSGTGWYTGSAIKGFADETWSGSAYGSYLSFHTVDNTTTTLDERVRIDHNGNVGIGVTDPAAVLELKGSGAIRFRGGHGGYGEWTTDTGNASTHRIYLRSKTNDGSLKTVFSASLTAQDTRIMGFGRDITNLQTLAGSDLFIDSSGKIGIGTIAPTNILHIVGSAVNTELILDNTDGDDVRLFCYDQTNAGNQFGISKNGMGGFIIESNTLGVVGSLTNVPLAFATNALERMRILADGKVGIGTTVPVTDLTIDGTITLKEQADADADTATYGQLWVNTATPNELFFTDDAGEDFNIGSRKATTGKAIAMAMIFGG